MRNVALTCTAIMLLGSTGGALAEEMGEFRCAKPGTVLEFSNGNKSRIVGQVGLDCSYRSEVSGRAWTDHAFFIQVTPVGEGVTPEIIVEMEKLWPLRAGKSVDFWRKSGGYEYHDTYTVKPIETMQVTAGSFPAWRIDLERVQIPSNNTIRHTYWWAPSIPASVKYEARPIRGNWLGVAPDYQLVAVRAP